MAAEIKPGAQLDVWSERENANGAGKTWVRAGTCTVNKDGSLAVLLDVLPLDGKLHIRAKPEGR